MPILTHLAAATIGALIGMAIMALFACRRDRHDKAALWEILGQMRPIDQHYAGVKGILERHGVEVVEGEEVF